jgi:hypothetical protein
MEIASTEQVTPKLIATTIVRDTALQWVVECEGYRCANRIAVAKRTYRPVDYSRPDGPQIKTELTAPDARRCAACGPFPK